MLWITATEWREGGKELHSASPISKYRRTEGAYRLVCEGTLHMVRGIYFFNTIQDEHQEEDSGLRQSKPSEPPALFML